MISWDPIPGASFHLEIDDDPNFGSPEVDVTVAGTSYALSGQRLRLNGRQSWAAYVRINGTRWNANTFTPSYFGGRGENAALAVTSENLVFLAFHDPRIQLTASSDWSLRKRLSLEDTFNADAVNLAVDEFDVAHAFWFEQRPTTDTRVPSYASSATGSDLVQVPGLCEGCMKGSSFAARDQFDIFYHAITRTKSPVGPLRTEPSSLERRSPTVRIPTAQASPAMEWAMCTSPRRATMCRKITPCFRDRAMAGFLTQRQLGGHPTVAVTREGELHALRWGREQIDAPSSMPFLYSNSLAGSRRGRRCPSAHRMALVMNFSHLSWTQRAAGCTRRYMAATVSTFVPLPIQDSPATRAHHGHARR